MVPIKRVCTEHATKHLRSYSRQSTVLGLIMGLLAVVVAVAILTSATDVTNWKAQFILPAIFLIGSLLGFIGRRKSSGDIRELAAAEGKQEASKSEGGGP